MKKEYRQAVFVVIYKKEKNKIFYLLLKRKKHWIGWEFTKGGIEQKETPLFAAKREAFEESGLTPIKIIGFEKSGDYKYKTKLKDRPGIIGQTYTLFAAQVKEDNNKVKSKIKIDKKEHSDYVWLDFSSALQTLTYKNQKDCLEIVNKFLEK